MTTQDLVYGCRGCLRPEISLDHTMAALRTWKVIITLSIGDKDSKHRDIPHVTLCNLIILRQENCGWSLRR